VGCGLWGGGVDTGGPIWFVGREIGNLFLVWPSAVLH